MIKKNALIYLGYKNQQIPENIDILLDECIKEVEKRSTFKTISATFTYEDNTIKELELPLHSEDTKIYFQGCNEVLVTAYTLGVELERYIRYLSKSDMTKSVIMDCVASAYLEYRADLHDEQTITKPRTYRFAPGYGDLPIELNKVFYEVLNLPKNLGVTLTESGLFLPQKTMLCIIGLGHSNLTKSCGNCIKIKDCFLRKEGLRCWHD